MELIWKKVTFFIRTVKPVYKGHSREPPSFSFKYWTSNILCWTLWEYLFTHNTEEYFILSTVRKFNYTKYWGILYVEHRGKIYLHKIPSNIVYWALWEDLFTQNTEEYFMLNTVRRFVYTKYWGILLCWALCEDLFPQNTEEYFQHKVFPSILCK
jgi:hypothetical protein